MPKKEGDISIKDLIILFREYFKEIKRKWLTIVFFVLPFMLYFVYNAFNSRSEYPAKVKFILEKQSGGGISAISGILGNFGINSGGDRNSLQITEVANSNILIGEVLMSRSSCRNDLIINTILDIYNLRERWTNDSLDFQGLTFSPNEVNQFSNLEMIAYKRIINMLDGSNTQAELYSIKFNKETAVYSIDCKSYDECLSIDLAKFSFDKLKEFYEYKILEQKEATRDMLKSKRDSLNNLLNIKMNELAEFQDYNRNLLLEKNKVTNDKLRVEINALGSVYSEASKNYELADISLRENRPLFIKIDQSLRPIEPESVSIIKMGFLGIILGLFFAIFYIVTKKLYRDAIS